MKNMSNIEEFLNLDIRVGTIIEAEIFKEAKKPAYKLKIDFGKELGIKKSSAQITKRYNLDDLINKQIIAVVNFSPRQIANFMSEVLVLGIYNDSGVVLLTPDKIVNNGEKIG